MAIANYYEQKPLILFTFKKLCNGDQRLAAQQFVNKYHNSCEKLIFEQTFFERLVFEYRPHNTYDWSQNREHVFV